MITRFRVEGRGKDKQELIDELAVSASRVIGILQDQQGKLGEWECTDDVVSGIPLSKDYAGRMVFRLERAGNGRN